MFSPSWSQHVFTSISAKAHGEGANMKRYLTWSAKTTTHVDFIPTLTRFRLRLTRAFCALTPGRAYDWSRDDSLAASYCKPLTGPLLSTNADWLTELRLYSPNLTQKDHFGVVLHTQSLALVLKKQTKANNTRTKWQKHTRSKPASKENLNQPSALRTAHMCVWIVVYNCRTQYRTKQSR